uniref:Orcokinin-like transcript b n=1 Tax=Tenebrio molitor TaxID=7067 RepID=A0A977XEV3_TENMO|nr:orcokinin-like transcript b [Tenebrio molitor]
MWFITPLFVVFLALGAIDAAPNLARLESNYNPYGEIQSVMGRKSARNFGVLQLGGGYGVAKRFSPSSNKYEMKTEKHRRGPLNGLIPGGAFGRAARSNCARYFSFDVESRNDSGDGQGMRGGQENMPTSIDAYYTPYQSKQFLEVE